jgi:hypothetical protein
VGWYSEFIVVSEDRSMTDIREIFISYFWHEHFNFMFIYNRVASLLCTTKQFLKICRPVKVFFPCGSTAKFWALTASKKLSVSFRLLDLGHSAGLLGRVISSSQGLCVSAAGDYEDGEVGGMNGFGRGNWSTRRNPTPTPLCPPQIPLARPGREPGPPRWEASD